MTFHPGDIFYADVEDADPHPYVIVSRESLNRGGAVIAAMITSSHYDRRASLPNCVPLHHGISGVTKDCVVQCENLSVIDVADIDIVRGRVGKLDDIAMRDVIKSIGYVIDANCEPV